MKLKLVLFLFLSVLSYSSYGEESLQDKADTLNSSSIELFDLSVLELAKLIELPRGGYFVPVDALGGRDDLELLESIEKKGYINIDEINEQAKKRLGDIPFNSTDRHIYLTPKGKKIVNAFKS